ncbi:MAG: lysoplasmalogenase [Candidatus Nanopelagicales bacterium]|nr:lysoplasmalogenase [Candidatus Nanopelagicales bacterium]
MTGNPATGVMKQFTALPPTAHLVGALFVVLSLANIAGVAWTKPLLMPALLLWVIDVTRTLGNRGLWFRWLVAALLFSWLGDIALMGTSQAWFLIGIGAFALAQISYIAMFTKVTKVTNFTVKPGISLVRAWKFTLIPYVGYWITMNVVITAGVLQIPVVFYSALLTAMAISALNIALRLNRPWRFVPAVGAVSFVISDSMIALEEFNGLHVVPGLVMVTYLVGQAMIAVGVICGQAPTDSTSRSR